MSTAELEECKLSVYSQVWIFGVFLLITKVIFIAENTRHEENKKKKILNIHNSTTERYLKHLRACVSK